MTQPQVFLIINAISSDVIKKNIYVYLNKSKKIQNVNHLKVKLGHNKCCFGLDLNSNCDVVFFA